MYTCQDIFHTSTEFVRKAEKLKALGYQQVQFHSTGRRTALTTIWTLNLKMLFYSIFYLNIFILGYFYNRLSFVVRCRYKSIYSPVKNYKYSSQSCYLQDPIKSKAMRHSISLPVAF